MALRSLASLSTSPAAGFLYSSTSGGPPAAGAAAALGAATLPFLAVMGAGVGRGEVAVGVMTVCVVRVVRLRKRDGDAADRIGFKGALSMWSPCMSAQATLPLDPYSRTLRDPIYALHKVKLVSIDC